MAKPKKKQEEKQDLFIHKDALLIYTDGSFRPEGNAAYAFLIFSKKTNHITHMSRGAERDATINRMELMAINKALDHAHSNYVYIFSDSAYSIFSLSTWYKAWERNNWMTPLGQPVKNRELIQEILAKIKTRKFVSFVKVKAHTGDPFNSIVDFQASDLTNLMRSDPTLPDGPYPCK